MSRYQTSRLHIPCCARSASWRMLNINWNKVYICFHPWAWTMQQSHEYVVLQSRLQHSHTKLSLGNQQAVWVHQNGLVNFSDSISQCATEIKYLSVINCNVALVIFFVKKRLLDFQSQIITHISVICASGSTCVDNGIYGKHHDRKANTKTLYSVCRYRHNLFVFTSRFAM